MHADIRILTLPNNTNSLVYTLHWLNLKAGAAANALCQALKPGVYFGSLARSFYAETI